MVLPAPKSVPEQRLHETVVIAWSPPRCTLTVTLTRHPGGWDSKPGHFVATALVTQGDARRW